jgi:hypothetical protein
MTTAAPREALGELEERDHVAERQPGEHHDVEIRRRAGAAFLLVLGFCHGWLLLLLLSELGTDSDIRRE